jgi:hypothetical protein
MIRLVRIATLLAILSRLMCHSKIYEVAQGLLYLYSCNIVHGDVSGVTFVFITDRGVNVQ